VWLLYSLLITDCFLDSSSLKFFDCFFYPSSPDSSILPPRILLRPNLLASIDSSSTDPAAPVGKSDLLTDDGGGILSSGGATVQHQGGPQ
jgi:hypothetical protein